MASLGFLVRGRHGSLGSSKFHQSDLVFALEQYWRSESPSQVRTLLIAIISMILCAVAIFKQNKNGMI